MKRNWRIPARPHADPEDTYWQVFKAVDPDESTEELRRIYPSADKINAMNLIFFSTSGIHGHYLTIEFIEAALKKYPQRFDPDDDDVPEDYCDELTFLLVQPRICGMTYGNLRIRDASDIAWVKSIRAATAAITQHIGYAQFEETE